MTLKSVECSKRTYFDVLKNKCEPCDKTCSECTSNSNENCLKCDGLVLKEGKCVPKCGDGFFYSADLEQCLACHKNCATCDSEKNCKSCKANFDLSKKGECEMVINKENCGPDCDECTKDKKCLFCKNGL